MVRGDVILLCSDGLHGVVDDETLCGLLAGGGTPADIAAKLIKAALDRGGRDNITAVVARYEGA
jgi:protein phosphatase